MAEQLKDKKVLFLCPLFFNYHEKIMDAMKAMGAKVDYFDERPSNTFISKALLRINRNFISLQIKNYYEEITSKISNRKYDYVLICQAEATPISFLKEVRSLNPHAKMVLMLWDSVANKVNTLEKLNYFDEVYSFDKKDCEKFNLTFRPLFFDKEYDEIAKEKPTLIYDLFFVGTVHSDRFQILSKVKQQFEKNHLSVFYFMYIPSKIMYYQRKLLSSELNGSKITDFSFKSLPSTQLTARLKQSKAVVDIQHPKQTGLTMRTIEMLGANKKIITTNKDIQYYDFYHPNNVCIVDRENVVIPTEFMTSNFIPVDKLIKERYTIDYFILDILGLTEENSQKFYIKE